MNYNPTPKPKTVMVNTYGPAPRGRPVVVPPRNLKLGEDAARDQGYYLMWQKTMPQAMERAQAMMDNVMPPALMPESLRAVLARKHRREH